MTASIPATSPSPPSAGLSIHFTVVLRAESNLVELTREPVTDADCVDLFSETWRENVLRKGRPDVPFEEAEMRLLPSFKEGSDFQCAGFEVACRLPDGTEARSQFGLLALQPVASRAAERLLQSKLIQPEEKYCFEVIAEPGRPEPVAAAQESFAVIVKRPALTFLRVPLRPLLRESTVVSMMSDDCFPLFFTAQALARAERCARLGASQHPPVETGAVLIGSLCSCPESGEFFAVVHDALEVQDAEQTTFSLNYSSKSWTRLQALMKARQAAWPGRAERILGQCHGHNFLPNDGKTCEACPTRPVCDLSSVFVSRDDRLWSRAVFFRQPWQLCQIFGLTARNDQVSGLFGLSGGRLRERGFFLLPEFDLEGWSQP